MPVDETLVLLRPTRLAFWHQYALVLLVLSLAFGLAYLGMTVPHIAVWSAAIFSAFLLLNIEFNRLRSSYRITKNQVIVEDGIISKQRRSLFLYNIADLEVEQGYLQRLLGWGVVVIGSTSGREKTELEMLVRKPRKLIQTLEKLIHAYDKATKTKT